MGLDMWIDRRAKGAPEAAGEQIAYWRKVNWLHGYICRTFTKDGEDVSCRPVPLHREDIEDILEKINEVKAILSEAKLVQQSYENGEYVDVPGAKPIPVVFEDGRFKGVKDNAPYRIDSDRTDELDSLLPPTEGFFYGPTMYDDWYAYGVFMAGETLAKLLDAWDDEQYDYDYIGWW